MMHLGGYFEYSWGYSVHLRVTIIHLRDISMIHVGRYHEYIRGCSGSQYKSKPFINLLLHMNHDVPRCTHAIPPMY